MKAVATVLLLIGAVAVGALQVGYTLVNVREYDNDHFGLNDNSNHVVVGVFLKGKGSVDAQKVTQNPGNFGISPLSILGGKTKYLKVFGSGENYETMLNVNAATVATELNNQRSLKEQNSRIIIDWDQDLIGVGDEERTRRVSWLATFLSSFKQAFLKIPASYLCLNVGGTPLHKKLDHSFYILELYGRQNPYLSYESIFTKKEYSNESDGYTTECPRNPSTSKAASILPSAQINIEKTLHTEKKGYVGEMKDWAQQAQQENVFKGVLFFDQHPQNVIRL